MPFRPVPTNKFRKFLIHIGLKHVRTTGHEVWDKPDGTLLRPVIFRPSEKEIPPTHIKTNLFTLGMSYKEFEEILKCL